MAKSSHAQVSSIIRAELKKMGIKARVTSKSYSGGNSVDVDLVDEHPDTVKRVESYCNQFEYGHFDGMNDTYEYSNTRDDIPQVKYLFVRNDISDTMRNEVFNYLRTAWAGGEQLPESYEDARNIRFHDCWVSDFVWRLFTGACEGFWETKKAA